MMATLFGLFRFLRKLNADSGSQGAEFQAAMRRTLSGLEVETVK